MRAALYRRYLYTGHYKGKAEPTLWVLLLELPRPFRFRFFMVLSETKRHQIGIIPQYVLIRSHPTDVAARRRRIPQREVSINVFADATP